MRTKLEIVKAYGRYLESLKKENSNVIDEFGKMYSYINNKVVYTDEGLWQVLFFDCPSRALQVARDRKVRFKSVGYEWNQYSIDRCYKLIDNIIKSYDTQDLDTFRINVNRLFKLLSEDEEPNVTLYMWHTYGKTEAGRAVLSGERNRVNKLIRASTEEEIESILAE